jgi:hypothetical protein
MQRNNGVRSIHGTELKSLDLDIYQPPNNTLEACRRTGILLCFMPVVSDGRAEAQASCAIQYRLAPAPSACRQVATLAWPGPS